MNGSNTSASKPVGVVALLFILAISGSAQATEKILYSFTNSTDGGYPQSGLVIDSKGNLYGTTQSGGAGFQGTVYELSPGANGIWTESILYGFTGGADGGLPYTSRLAIDSAGNLYGVANSGGAYSFGVVFELVAGSNGKWTEKVLHSFTGGNDGAYPNGSSLVLDGAGGLYGIADNGGPHDYGVVFGLTPQSNGAWSEKIIYAFTGTDGQADPRGGLFLDSMGNLYGSANDVFELIPQPNGTRTKKTLHAFAGTPDGAFSQATLISDKAGNLYGTTYSGGAHYGTVFELTPGPGGNWQEKVLHRFLADGTDGIFPNSSSLAIDASGNLYGTTQTGGASNAGVVYEVTP